MRAVSRAFATALVAQSAWATPKAHLGFNLTYSLNDDGLGSLYFIDVAVGQPPQPQRLALDTSSADLLLHSTADEDYLRACTERTPSTCFSTYNNRTSATYVEVGPGAYSPTLGGVPNKGSYIKETLTLGSSVLKGQTMASSWSSKLPIGILGLAPPKDEFGVSAGTFGRYSTTLQSLASQNLISHAAYSLWLDPESSEPRDFKGRVDFGVLDTSLFTGQLVTLPVVTNRTTALDKDPFNWNVALGAIAKTSTPNKNALVGRPVSCTIESGSTFISFNNASFFELASQFPTATANRSIPGLTFYNIPCPERHNPKNGLQLTLLDPRDPKVQFKYVVPPEQVIWPSNLVVSGTDPATCALNALSWEEVFAGSALLSKYECIIGSAALKSVYSIFDLENLEISFAHAVPKRHPSLYRDIHKGGVSASY